MALYRLRGATGNENSYVYTNPDPTTTISHRDRVFVLGKEVSDEIMGDKFEMMDRQRTLPFGLDGEQQDASPGSPLKGGKRPSKLPPFDPATSTKSKP
jgi:hypothetical protein